MPGSQPYPAMPQSPSQAYPSVPQMPGSQPYPGMLPPASGYPGAPGWPPADGHPLFQPPSTPATRGERSLRTVLLGAASVIVLLVIYFTLPGAAAAGVRTAYPTVHAVISGVSNGQNVTSGQSITFSAAQSSGSDLTYAWDFGDNTNATGQAVTHTFQQSAQNDMVTLSASDPLGASGQGGHQDTNTITINVLPPHPKASFTFSVGTYDGFGYPVSFDASASTGENLQFQWNFGDGNTGFGMQTSNEYASTGQYVVSLTVIDDANQSDITSQTVTI